MMPMWDKLAEIARLLLPKVTALAAPHYQQATQRARAQSLPDQEGNDIRVNPNDPTSQQRPQDNGAQGFRGLSRSAPQNKGTRPDVNTNMAFDPNSPQQGGSGGFSNFLGGLMNNGSQSSSSGSGV